VAFFPIILKAANYEKYFLSDLVVFNQFLDINYDSFVLFYTAHCAFLVIEFFFSKSRDFKLLSF